MVEDTRTDEDRGYMELVSDVGLANLHPREEDYIFRNAGGEKLKDIAEAEGISRQRVHQIANRGRAKIQAAWA
jgi:DNA-directed RNA polymerase specialized sigma24 family protein